MKMRLILESKLSLISKTKSILSTAQELNSPVILGVSEGAGKYMGGYHAVVGMVNGLMQDMGITVPVALHLDHGSFEGCYKCIEAGFSSVMFDGSHYPIEENVEKTTQLVKDVHAFPGHIACDGASNSEIVIPIHVNGKVWGVLDIDSPLLGRFDEEDRDGLEKVVGVVEALLENNK